MSSRARGASALPLALVLSVATLAACSDDRPEDRLGTSAEALTSTVTIRRGTFGSVADTYISSSAATKNYGGQKKMVVSAQNEALLRFDLSSIPANAVVQSANLTLTVNGGEEEADDEGADGDHEGNPIAPIKVRRATAAWAEGLVTYRSFAQAFAPAVEGTIVLSSRRASKTVDLRALVAGWVAGTYANHGLVLTTAGVQHTIVVSSEHPPLDQRPTLVVRYVVPEDHCAANPCVHGACTNQLEGYTCACEPGYEGARCDVNIDDCSPNPCLHGACTDQLGGFACACDVGYSGPTCAVDINGCAPNPCVNGGTCTDTVGGYTCTCPAGLSGVNCEIVDACSPVSNPCQNGGTCAPAPGNTYTCACPAGYAGANCETDIVDCVPGVCGDHGVCADGVNSYTCACDPGYTGARCDEIIDHCTPDACANGGTCVTAPIGYSCACEPGYEGPTCLVDHNDCDPNLCPSGTQCVDRVDGFQCVAPATTRLVLTHPATVDIGDAFTISATLTRETAPAGVLSGALVTFRIIADDGAATQFAVQTDANGVATIQHSVAAVGTYSIVATYDGTLATAPASATGSFTAGRTLLVSLGAAHAVAGAPVTLHALVSVAGSGAPLDGVVVTFASSAGVFAPQTASTVDGVASVTVTVANAGDFEIEARVEDGGGLYSAAAVLQVTAAQSALDAITYSGPPGQVPVDQAVTLATRLQRLSAPAGPIAGALVTFTITAPGGGVIAGSSSTDGSGAVTYQFTPSVVGTYHVAAAYFGDGGTLPASREVDLTVVAVCAPGYEGADCSINHDDCAPDPCAPGLVCVDGVASYQCVVASTTLALSPISDKYVTELVTLSAVLTRDSAPAGNLVGAQVTFQVIRPGGSQTYTVTTNGAGVAQAQFTVPASGVYTVVASYAGSATTAPASDQETFTATRFIVLTANNAQGFAGGAVTLSASAYLLPSGAPVNGDIVNFTVEGTGITASAQMVNGSASAQVVLPVAGSFTYAASIVADGIPWISQAPISVSTASTQLQLNASAGTVAVGNGITFFAQLTRLSAPAGLVPGASVTLEISGPTGTVMLTSTTDQSGLATFLYTPTTAGTYTAAARYLGSAALAATQSPTQSFTVTEN